MNRQAQNSVLHAVVAAVGLLSNWSCLDRLDAAEVAVVDSSSALFADSHADFQIVVTAEMETAAVLNWTHLANDNRTLARGERVVRLSNTHPAQLRLPLRMPHIRDGVVWRTMLRITVANQANNEILASTERAVWVFPRDPFAEQRTLETALRLYDPLGATAEVLRSGNVAYDRIANVAQLNDLSDGIILIGEGVSYAREAGLAQELQEAARRGAHVICLAPSEGSIPLSTRKEPPRRLLLKQREAITDLDKRLDANHWADLGSPPTTQIQIVSDVNNLSIHFADGIVSWLWVDLYFAPGGESDQTGRLLVCGFHVVKHWDTGPTPRYLLARLLQQVESDQQ